MIFEVVYCAGGKDPHARRQGNSRFRSRRWPCISVDRNDGLNAHDALEKTCHISIDAKKFTYALHCFGSSLGFFVLMLNETMWEYVSVVRVAIGQARTRPRRANLTA